MPSTVCAVCVSVAVVDDSCDDSVVTLWAMADVSVTRAVVSVCTAADISPATLNVRISSLVAGRTFH
jgi:hypothetical protein